MHLGHQLTRVCCGCFLLLLLLPAALLCATGGTGKTASASKHSSPKFVEYVTIYSVKAFPSPLICTFFCCFLQMSTKTRSRRRSSSASEMISFKIFGISVPLSFFPQSGVVKAHKNSEMERTGFEKRKAGPSEEPSFGGID